VLQPHVMRRWIRVRVITVTRRNYFNELINETLSACILREHFLHLFMRVVVL
jgi:hypothetical protein